MYCVYPAKRSRIYGAMYFSTREQAEREKEKMEKKTWAEWLIKLVGGAE